MATAYSANVIRVESAAAFAYAKDIVYIKQLAGSAGTSTIKANADSSGEVIWQHAGNAATEGEVRIRDANGVYITPGTGATIFIYLKPERG